MSEQVQSIVDAVRCLDLELRRELAAALAAMATSLPATSSGRERLVASVRGKYRHVPTSSESFMDRKREEMRREFRSSHRIKFIR